VGLGSSGAVSTMVSVNSYRNSSFLVWVEFGVLIVAVAERDFTTSCLSPAFSAGNFSS
jgi:hypothetical protein